MDIFVDLFMDVFMDIFIDIQVAKRWVNWLETELVLRSERIKR